VTSDSFEPDDPHGSSPSSPRLPPDPSSASAPRARPGLSTFTIEGRAAPGLFVVGWLAALAGVGLCLIGVLASNAVFFYLLGPTLLTIGLVAGAGNQSIERRARGFAYAGPSPYLVLGAIVAAVYAVAAAVAFGLDLIMDPSVVSPPAINLLAILVQALVYFGIIGLTVVGTNALSWREMGWVRPDPSQVRNLLFGAATAIPVIGFTAIVSNVLVGIFQTVPESPLPPTGTTSGLLLQLLAGAVIAPIAEEAVFRGFAISAWERTVGATGAIVRSSLIFALAHVIEVRGGSVEEAAALIVIGFVTRLPVAVTLGWLFVRTRSIWASLGLHIAFNATLLLLAEYYLRGAGG
jgi:membrane protease YdiL (CAAX protease family)